jgi:hypothetical protein
MRYREALKLHEDEVTLKDTGEVCQVTLKVIWPDKKITFTLLSQSKGILVGIPHTAVK